MQYYLSFVFEIAPLSSFAKSGGWLGCMFAFTVAVVLRWWLLRRLHFGRRRGMDIGSLRLKGQHLVVLDEPVLVVLVSLLAEV